MGMIIGMLPVKGGYVTYKVENSLDNLAAIIEEWDEERQEEEDEKL